MVKFTGFSLSDKSYFLIKDVSVMETFLISYCAVVTHHIENVCQALTVSVSSLDAASHQQLNEWLQRKALNDPDSICMSKYTSVALPLFKLK